MTAEHTTTTSNCKICQAIGLQRLFEVRGQVLFRCKKCGFVHVGTQPSPETLASVYNPNYYTGIKYGSDSTALQYESQRRLGLLEMFVPQGGIVLDAGCSTGDFIDVAKDRYRMYGFDYSDVAVAIAKRRFPDLATNICQGTLEKMPWSDVKFDAICLWDVIEHLWDPVPVVAALLQQLKPGGVLLISTPAIDAYFSRMLGPYWPFMTPPEHLSFFTAESFAKMTTRLRGIRLVYQKTRGKWANLAFVFHKIQRIAPDFIPAALFFPFKRWPFDRISLYIPTSDIRYIALQTDASPVACD